MGEPLSDCVENNVGKGEITCYVFSQCFQKLSIVDVSK